MSPLCLRFLAIVLAFSPLLTWKTISVEEDFCGVRNSKKNHVDENRKATKIIIRVILTLLRGIAFISLTFKVRGEDDGGGDLVLELLSFFLFYFMLVEEF